MHKSISSVILSPSFRNWTTSSGRYRTRRHLVFWTLFIIYFYAQGISPNCIRGLPASDVFAFSFYSVLAFTPVCAGCVYSTLYLLSPALLEKKKYRGFVIGIFLQFLLATSLNYFFSVLFFKLSCHCNPDTIPFMRKFEEGFINSQNAVIAGCAALGVKLAIRWYYQKTENLRLAQLRIKTSLAAQKTKTHPDYMLRSLKDIADHIRAGKTDPPAMILHLSQQLSEWTYDELSVNETA